MGLRAQDRRRPLARPGDARRGSARWARAACGWHEAQRLTRRAVRRQHAPRRRHRGRQGRGAAAPRFSVERLRRRRPRRRDRRRCADAAVDELVADYERATTSRRRSSPAAPAATRCVEAARIEAGPARVPRGAGASARSPTPSRTSTACASCPGSPSQRLMADGYGFGAEGDWKTAALRADPQGHGDRPAGRHVVHGGLHLRPRGEASR